MSPAIPKPPRRQPKPRKRIRTKRPLGTVRREAKVAGDLTQEQWEQICQFYSVDGAVRCPYCWEQGHIQAIAKGGKHTAANVIPICERCNRRQGTQTWTVPRPHPFMSWSPDDF